MTGYDVHFVGSIPLKDARDVFTTIGRQFGPRLQRLPDGETGERLQWLGWIEPVFAQNPALEATGESSRVHERSTPRPLHRVRPGISAADVKLSRLRIAETALASYRDFAELKAAGTIPANCRFQVSIANPVSVVHRFVAEADQDAIVAAYERAMLGEIAAFAAAIPHDQLAVQFDVAQHVFTPLETGSANRFGQTRGQMLEAYSAHAIRWGDAVPAGVELLYHLCYGDNAHRHAVEPASLAVQVDFANALCAGIGRTIEVIHMSVPRDRDDDAYFEPLRRLRLRPETRIALGLIHYTDGVAGTRRRIATAEKYLDDFLVATECGLARRPRETIQGLLRIHAEVAGVA
jgi:methionine synthase II (cobalamin-independent)